MPEQLPAKPSPVERILEEARRAGDGSAATPVSLIEAQDRDLARALRKASDADRPGLLRLFQKLGARGKRAAEQALGQGGLDPRPAAEILAWLRERDPRHAAVLGWDGIGPALERADIKPAAAGFVGLPAALRGLWARQEAPGLLAAGSPGLAGLLEDCPEAVAALVEALGRETPRAALDGLAALARETRSKPLQKSVRAAFFRLQQLGSEVPEIGAPIAASAPAVPPELEARAWISAVDGAGDQAVWIAEELPEGGVSLLQAVISDDGSLSLARAMVLTRRGYDTVRASLADEGGPRHAELPLPVAMGLVEDAYASNPAAASREYAAWRRNQGADRRARRPEPLAVPEAEREALAAASDELFRDGGLPQWLLGRAEAERAEAMVAEATTSSLVLPEHETAERRERALASVAEALLGGPRRTRMARRMAASARYFLALKDERRTGLAAASAALLSMPGAPLPAALRRMVSDSLEALARVREHEKAGAQPGPAPGHDTQSR